MSIAVRDDDGAGVKGAMTWGGRCGPGSIRFFASKP
jgi:hypothetical protein